MSVFIFVALVPVFLAVSSVRWVVNAPVLYDYGFDKYEISSRTRIEKSELLLAASYIREYFNNDQEFLDVKVRFWDGFIYPLYNSREVEHMRDVKGLIRGVYLVQWVIGVYLIAFFLIGLMFLKRRFLTLLSYYVALGGVGAIFILLLAGLVSLLWFDKLFPPGETEKDLLECVGEPGPTSRLSCQISMQEALEGITVRLPASQY